jgi:hypothetical protein
MSILSIERLEQYPQLFPADYELSGHRALIGHAPPVLVDVAVALNTFGEEMLADARTAYLEYVRCVAEARWFRGKVRELPWWEQVKNDHETVDAIDAPPTARTFDGANTHRARRFEQAKLDCAGPSALRVHRDLPFPAP